MWDHISLKTKEETYLLLTQQNYICPFPRHIRNKGLYAENMAPIPQKKGTEAK